MRMVMTLRFDRNERTKAREEQDSSLSEWGEVGRIEPRATAIRFTHASPLATHWEPKKVLFQGLHLSFEQQPELFFIGNFIA